MTYPLRDVERSLYYAGRLGGVGYGDAAFEKTASYIIRKNGSYCEAINGSTGKIDYTHTSPNVVLTNILGSNQKLMFKTGDYIIGDIDLSEYVNLNILGCGRATTLRGTFTVKSNATTRKQIVLEKFCLVDTTTRTKTGVHLQSPSSSYPVVYVICRDLYIYGFDLALKLETLTDGHLTTCYFNNILIEDCLKGLISSQATSNKLGENTYIGLKQICRNDSTYGFKFCDFYSTMVDLKTIDAPGGITNCLEFTSDSVENVTVGGTFSTGKISDSGTNNHFYTRRYIKPPPTAKSANSVDLSGGSQQIPIFHSEDAHTLTKMTLLYTEASSSDVGVGINVGRESNLAYYYTGTSETDKALWYTLTPTLLQTAVAAGDTVILYTPGGKAGAGEIMAIVEYY